MLLLIEGNGFMHWAHHGNPHLTRASDGTPCGAVYGFTSLVADMCIRHPHTHVAVVFDAAGGSAARKRAHPAYKANRAPKSPAFTSQHALVREAADALGVPWVEVPGHEADDVIATYVRMAVAAGLPVLILSDDKDFMQLLHLPDVRIRDPKRAREYGIAECRAKFGVDPPLVPHVQALWGDAVDGIPGVPGIGTKTASQMINHFGSLEALLTIAADEETHIEFAPVNGQRRTSLVHYAQQARLSYALARLDDQVPVDRGLDDLRARPRDDAALAAFLDKMEFVSLRRRFFGGHAA